MSLFLKSWSRKSRSRGRSEGSESRESIEEAVGSEVAYGEGLADRTILRLPPVSRGSVELLDSGILLRRDVRPLGLAFEREEDAVLRELKEKKRAGRER